MHSDDKPTAFVTGASSGIGEAVALALGEIASVVGLSGRDSARLSSVQKAIEARGATAYACPCDFDDLNQVTSLAAKLSGDLRRLDILVHAAGMFESARVEECALTQVERLLRVNLLAPWILTRELLPLLKAAQGQVVFVNSTVLANPAPGLAAYAASKHALKGLADGLRCEVNEAGVRVLTIYPGRTASRMQEGVHQQEGRAYQPDRLVQAEDIAAMILTAVRLPRTAEVTEITIRPMRKS